MHALKLFGIRLTLACATLLAMDGANAQGGSPAALRLLNNEDFYRVHDVSEPHLSPDGNWVAYVLGSNDHDSDEARSAVWMVSWDGRERLALTGSENGIGKPGFSPDGRYLAYLSTPSGAEAQQLMLLDRRGGAPRHLTTTDAVLDYAWSPDGQHLALVVQTAAPTTMHPQPIVISALHFKEDAAGYLAVGAERHLALLDVQNGELQALTPDGFNDEQPAWAPDARRLAFVRTRERGADEDGRADLDVMEAQSGGAVQRLARIFVPNHQQLEFSPDGKRVAYLAGREPQLNAYMQDHLFDISVGGGAPRALGARLDRAVMSYCFNDAGGAMLLEIEDDRAEYPVRLDPASGAITRVPLPGRFVAGPISCANGRVAMLKSDDSAPAELYALEGAQLRKLTGHNDALMAELRLGAVEELEFSSTDHAKIHALLITPPDYAATKMYPLLLWIHGGPNGQDEHSLVLDGYQFEPQYFAALGYLVLRVNYRGSAGRGAAFAETIKSDWGHKEVQDLLAGVNELVAAGRADPRHLDVGGWSYGGLLTDYMIASDTRFKAAISGAGSGNQLSTYGADQYVLQYSHELGAPWADSALWLKLSYPFFHAERIHTPTLFLGGEKDFNVPIVGGEQMYQALRSLGVPAQLVIYPGEHHVVERPSFLVDLAQRMAAWLQQHDPYAQP